MDEIDLWDLGAGEMDGSDESSVGEEQQTAWEPGEVGPYEVSVPYLRPEPKVGRNEACPCGSGKKYKKCCGNS